MAKRTAAPRVSVDDLVNNALRRVAEATDPLRLSGKTKEGEPPALFEKAAGTSKQAIEQLTEGDKSLIVVSGSATQRTVAGLTVAGLDRIAASLSEDKLAAAVKALAEGMKARERVAFLSELISRSPGAAAELLPSLKAAEQQQALDDEAELAAAVARRDREEAQLAAVEEWKATIHRLRRTRVETLRRLLAAEGATDESAPPPVPPRTDDEKDFRRDTIDRLVAAWLHHTRHNRPDIATALERALRGVSGVVPVGSVGQTVAFDGRIHECERPISDGATTKVIRPGWALEDDPGPPIQRALVE